MLTDQQHTDIKRLLKQAIDGSSHEDRKHALEDACKIVGVVSDRHFFSADMMKAGRNSNHAPDEELRAAAAGPHLTGFWERQYNRPLKRTS